jgi:hypothetical protein
MNNDIKVKLCQDDFYLMMRNACLQAGGGDVEKLKRMSLSDVVNMLAQNGIRLVYMPEKHMDSVKIVWESPKARTDGNLPKKKQLLCDSLDKGEKCYGEDGYEWDRDEMGG